jgi:hypothetical protein
MRKAYLKRSTGFEVPLTGLDKDGRVASKLPGRRFGLGFRIRLGASYVMETTRRRPRIGLFLFAAAFAGLPIPSAQEPFLSVDDALTAAGRRLCRSKSESALTALASRGDALLKALDPAERSALATRCLRFRVNSPVVVRVAAPATSVPFWVQELGFKPDDRVLTNEDASWKLFRKTYGPGAVGLGVNGLDRTPAAHYAVFITPVDRQRPESPEDLLVLDPRSAGSWKAVRVRSNVSAAHDVYKPFTTIPDELLDSILLQPAHEKRHATLLATGRVWKTHVIAGPRPEQATISFGTDPAHELVFSWTTSTPVSRTALRIAAASSQALRERDLVAGAKSDPGTRLVTGDSTLLKVPNLLNDPIVLRHRVAVGGLTPDTTYRYSIGDGSAVGWGPWRTVKTAPELAKDVRFLYLGDAQTGLEGWGTLLRTAYRRHPDIDFLIVAGDLVDRGNERTNWDHFFLRAADVFERVPFMPCVGNHEYLDVGPRLYRAFFELPRNGPAGSEAELVYQFECGDAFFAMLDSTLAVADSSEARRQAEWLDAALARTHAPWKLVVFHHPVYPSHPWRETPNLRELWVPVFDRHHVDLVLQGHDHAYLRTHSLRAHRRVNDPGAGTTYVVAVSGDKFVDQAHRDYIAVGYTGLSTYQTIEINAQKRQLAYRAWSEAGKIVDELVLDKRPK